MPSFNAHYLFAKQEVDFIRKTFPDVELNEDILWYAAQGPDMMFFARLFPAPIMPGESLMPVGNALHAANPTQIFKAIQKYFLEHPEDHLVKSFFLGFICHYALDRNCHPFVYAKEQVVWNDNKNWNRMWIHNVIEHNFDTWAIRKYCGIESANKFKSFKVLKKDEKIDEALGRGFAYLTPRVTDINLSAEAASCCGRDSRNIMRWLQDSTGLKRKIFGGLMNAFTCGKNGAGPMGICFFVPGKPVFTVPRSKKDYDLYNDSHSEWTEPRNPEFKSRKNLEEIFEESYKDLEQMLLGLRKAIDERLDDLTFISGDRSFESTLKSPKCENPAVKMD